MGSTLQKIWVILVVSCRKKAPMLHPDLLYFFGMISINISSSNIINAKKGQQSCMIIHRMTPIIPPPLIYPVRDGGTWREAVSQRDRNLCDQHENNIRLTRPSLICRTQWKEKKRASKLWGLHAGSSVDADARSSTSASTFHRLHLPLPRVLFLLHFCLMVNSQIWRPTWVDVPMLMYLFKAAWVHICLFFST